MPSDETQSKTRARNPKSRAFLHAVVFTDKNGRKWDRRAIDRLQKFGIRYTALDIDQISPGLAAYLGIGDTQELRNFIYDAGIKTIVLKPFNEALSKFSDENSRSSMATIFKWIHEHQDFDRTFFNSSVIQIPNGVSELPKTSHRKAMCWVVAMHQLTRNFPQYFLDGQTARRTNFFATGPRTIGFEHITSFVPGEENLQGNFPKTSRHSRQSTCTSMTRRSTRSEAET